MKTFNFPYIAVGFGLFLLLVVMVGNNTDSNDVTALPLLTLLVISEFAFFVTAAGAYIGIKHIRSVGLKPVYTTATISCILLAAQFMIFGIDHWPL